MGHDHATQAAGRRFDGARPQRAREYKDIAAVMAAQADLVSVVARFDPKIVKMAPEGERAED